MAEDASTSEGKRKDRLDTGFDCRWCRFRIYFLVLLVMTFFVFYYVNLSEVSEIWISTVQIIHNATHRRGTSNSTFTTAPPLFTSTSINPVMDISAPSSLVTPVTVAEQCTPAMPYHVAYPCVYHYIINEPDRCQNENPFLVLMVPVAPGNREARDAIRSTWGTEKVVMDKVVSLFFLLGEVSPEVRDEQQQKLSQESEEYHDIVQSDFLDSYNNLTIKTMMILEWLASHCRNASYAMKIDSDMFLNVNNLVSTLLQAPRQNFITGLVASGGMVLRDPHSKWYLPKDVFPEDSYPPYALGLGYVFSLDMPEKLIEGAKHVKAVYIEDVYLGLCMRHLGLSFTSLPGNLFHVFPVPYDRCRYSKLIATTTRNVQEQVNSWKDLMQPGPSC
ncbi:beta-1,3-galactosyltransferase 1-like isoform X2 [Brachyhypopomus gauderio]|uniref:beta-1,3-galactosyltransferase 1-like isoform X2 n=1 Tax=Brachyhypopomus gauderio TaxID=698409 RepID=UPI004042C4BC